MARGLWTHGGKGSSCGGTWAFQSYLTDEFFGQFPTEKAKHSLILRKKSVWTSQVSEHSVVYGKEN